MQTLMPPPARTLDDLVAGMPGRGRCLSEAGWVAAALLALGWVASALGRLPWSQTARQLVLSACLVAVVVWAYGLVRPWRAWRAGRTWSAVLVAITLAPLAVLSASGFFLREEPPSPRVGVQQSVTAATPADGRLEAGGAAAPASGLRKAFRWTVLRDLALLAVLWLMLRADGQGVRAVGLDRRHLKRELPIALPAFALLMVSHLGVSMVVGLLALAFAGGSLLAEVGQRQVVAGTLLSEQLILMVPLILVAGATEEIAFRGFLLPRLRVTLGGWVPALLAGAALFGAGHLYEGPLATVQTASMGLVLGLIYLWRRQLLACVLSHVAFNSLALLLFWTIARLGLLERAGEILRH